MTRRDQQIPPPRVRVSHETTRYSSQWLAEAFERLLPQVERRLVQPGELSIEPKSSAPGETKKIRRK
ncbi:MAG TPA: hypothetical protein VKB08_08195 [Bradyrhizobium sp.]|nr:hypothetical protein [Bradyrhizobium sp.]